ncbi:glycosyl hydrolase family 28-related protein [uncultured Roseobacter sp.]|uniref:glycosyl hydrolase family 28-related protein n=1 Tax=uncultured Roseobacter sp. TaxID=114847 RepID=UPI002620BB2C|nr:glycosyl hydrolase family 28-related protein [uncultured Roseobacter sp.]
MNKVITDGVHLMPIAFARALDVYSSEDGTPGTATYADAADIAQLVSDAEFGVCLELRKVEKTQKIRYMGEIPLLPGCYLRITARIKVMDGPLPSVRIAGFAGGAGGAPIAGVVTTGPAVTVMKPGTVVEVSAIVGAGARPGVDMVWGADALYGHFGIDLTGPVGGRVRVDDLIIEDVTSFFLRDLIAMVDVRDYGARGDGVTDDTAAFRAADAAARGRQLLVSQGTYLLSKNLTLASDVRFEGVVSMPEEAVLTLRRNFDLPSYIDAFGRADIAFRKGFQALLNSDDQKSFDLCGHLVSLAEPMVLRAAQSDCNRPVRRRVLRNGRIEALGSQAWASKSVSCTATVSKKDQHILEAAGEIIDVPVGALVQAQGVGPEIYVRAVDPARHRIALSAPLEASDTPREFSFTRFKYLLDFSGIEKLSGLALQDIELICNNVASGIMLSASGQAFQLKDCAFSRPGDRGVTSTGEGCSQLLVDRCEITADSDAQVVGLNANAGGVRVFTSYASGVRHFGVLGGAHNILMGNQTLKTSENGSAWVFRQPEEPDTPI